MARLSLFLLGPPRLEREGAEIHIGQRPLGLLSVHPTGGGSVVVNELKVYRLK
jgi:hypothetical protein